MATFNDAFDRLLGHEGKLSLDPKDSGNWTGGAPGKGQLKGSKYGISAASYPNEDIANLTPSRAKIIFRRDYWDRVQAEQLPDGVAYQLADFAYNSGPETAVRYLQRAIGVADDGRWGPVSQAALETMTESDLIMLLNGERLDFMTRCSGWVNNSRGWARRIAGNLRFGAADS